MVPFPPDMNFKCSGYACSCTNFVSLYSFLVYRRFSGSALVSFECPENTIDRQSHVSGAASFISALKMTPGLVLIFRLVFRAQMFFRKEGWEADHTRRKMFLWIYISLCCCCCFYAAFNGSTDNFFFFQWKLSFKVKDLYRKSIVLVSVWILPIEMYMFMMFFVQWKSCLYM